MDEKTIKQIAWEEIQRLGDQLRQADPGLNLSPQAARAKVMRETEQGKQLAALMRDPDALLTVSEFKAKANSKAALAALGVSSWDALVAKLAREYAKAAGTDHQTALSWVRKNCANVVEMSRRERPWGGR